MVNIQRNEIENLFSSVNVRRQRRGNLNQELRKQRLWRKPISWESSSVRTSHGNATLNISNLNARKMLAYQSWGAVYSASKKSHISLLLECCPSYRFWSISNTYRQHVRSRKRFYNDSSFSVCHTLRNLTNSQRNSFKVFERPSAPANRNLYPPVNPRTNTELQTIDLQHFPVIFTIPKYLH